MADRIKLDFENRTLVGKKVNRLRRQGLLPATVYGKGVGPFTVQLNARTFADAYRHAGRTGLLDLGIPGQKGVSAFIHNLQRHPVTRAITHVDFLVVDLLIEVTVDVPVHIVGDSELVRRGDALLNQVLTALSVRALPTDIPSAIEVDVTVTATVASAVAFLPVRERLWLAFLTTLDRHRVSLATSLPQPPRFPDRPAATE